MLKQLKELESAILFKLDISQNNANLELITNDMDPLFRIDANAKCDIVTRPVPNYENEDQLTKLNLFLNLKINNTEYHRNLFQFLEKYMLSANVDQKGGWFPFRGDGDNILLKITDQTEYYIKDKKKLKEVNVDWNIWSNKNGGNITLIFSRGYDIISEQSYWCLNQITDSCL